MQLQHTGRAQRRKLPNIRSTAAPPGFHGGGTHVTKCSQGGPPESGPEVVFRLFSSRRPCNHARRKPAGCELEPLRSAKTRPDRLRGREACKAVENPAQRANLRLNSSFTDET